MKRFVIILLSLVTGAVALYLALPSSPVAAALAGLLWGLGFGVIVALLAREVMRHAIRA